jgi:hypothetical protein
MSTIPVLNGNTIILPFKFVTDATAFAVEAGLTQFAVRRVPDGFSLSTPVTKELEELIPGIIHGARCRAEPDKPKPTGPKGGPKGTPPQGGSPAAGQRAEFINTEARAA